MGLREAGPLAALSLTARASRGQPAGDCNPQPRRPSLQAQRHPEAPSPHCTAPRFYFLSSQGSGHKLSPSGREQGARRAEAHGNLRPSSASRSQIRGGWGADAPAHVTGLAQAPVHCRLSPS